MDQSKIDKSCELTFREAIDIMNKEGAVTDGCWLFGTSTVQRLDGWLPNFVFSFEDFDSDPSNFYTLSEFQDYCDGKSLYIYKIPLTAQQAVEAMRSGDTVIDVEDSRYGDRKRYFMRSVCNPFVGDKEYIFSTIVPGFELELKGTPEDFVEGNGGPHFEVFVEEDNE